jgi:hypothetical protein
LAGTTGVTPVRGATGVTTVAPPELEAPATGAAREALIRPLTREIQMTFFINRKLEVRRTATNGSNSINSFLKLSQ